MSGKKLVKNMIENMQRRTNRAFSLVEIAMVVALMGTLAAIAAPRYATFLREQRLDSAERKIRADLALAQRRARYLGAAQTVSFVTATNHYSIVGMADPDRVGMTYAVKLADEPYRVTLVSANVGGDNDLVFDGHGAPDTAGNIVISLGGQTRTISWGLSFIPWINIDPTEEDPEAS